MPKQGTTARSTRSPASPLVVRLDAASKVVVTEASQLRHISISDYVRTNCGTTGASRG